MVGAHLLATLVVQSAQPYSQTNDDEDELTVVVVPEAEQPVLVCEHVVV